MITEELKELVAQEAANLKIHATEDEKSKLSLINLIYYSQTGCVYGLMTGNCFNSRAVELINKCCERVYKSEDRVNIRNSALNGSPNGKKRDRTYTDYFSPIEVLLDNERFSANNKNSKTAQVIQFIKGEISELNL